MVTGTAANELLSGSNLGETIKGMGGADTILGLGGGDLIYGDDVTTLAAVPPSDILVTPISPLWQVDSAVTGLAGGGFMVAYSSSPVSPHPSLAAQSDGQIMVRVYNAAGQPVTGELTVNQNALGDQGTPSITKLGNGDVAVVWTDNHGYDGSGSGVFGRILHADGSPSGAEFQINSVTANAQNAPAVTALPNGGFSVSFGTLNTTTGSTYDIAMRSFDNSGVATTTADVVVNTSLPAYQFDSAITAVGTAGDVVVSWFSTLTTYAGTGYNNSAYTGNIYLQRMTSAGVKTGAEIKVNLPNHSEYDGHPRVMALANGNYLVTWDSYDADADAVDVLSRIVQPNGTLMPVTQVNTYTDNFQHMNEIVALTGGGYVVTWQSFGQDGDNNGVFAQVFAANGTKVGGEVQVNVGTSAHQMNPSIAALANGGFVISWESGNFDLINPTQMGVIKARMFAADGTPMFSQADGDDSIDGGNGADTIFGGGGNDFINGNNGHDVIHGGNGADTVIGQAGNDQIFGDAGADILEGGSGADTLNGQAGNDALWGETGNDKLFGGAGTDSLHGEDGADQLSGGVGADTLTGENGNDTLNGGTGNDALTGDAGKDLLKGGAGDDLVLGGLGNDELRGGGGADDLQGNIGADLLKGAAGADMLKGGDGNDTLMGQGGADTLSGGLGSDHLTGGGGADVFVFATATEIGNGSGGDTVTDFNAGVDKIDLSAIFGGTATVAFLSGAAPFTGLGEVHYDTTTGTLTGNVSGTLAADFALHLQGNPVLSLADLIL